MILRILPLLTDPNVRVDVLTCIEFPRCLGFLWVYTQVEVRYAAFSALRAITGVANRSQLHRLLVKLGLLQHVTTDEV